MERDEVIKLAKEAGAYLLMRLDGVDTYQISGNASIERFAALVEAAATEKANERANASWASMCEKMVVAEREACAQIVQAELIGFAEQDADLNRIIATIRARGNQK